MTPKLQVTGVHIGNSGQFTVDLNNAITVKGKVVRRKKKTGSTNHYTLKFPALAMKREYIRNNIIRAVKEAYEATLAKEKKLHD